MLPSQRRGWAHRGEDEISVARMGRSDEKEERRWVQVEKNSCGFHISGHRQPAGSVSQYF